MSSSSISCSSACALFPGVTRAGIISRLPFDVWTHPFTIVGRPAPEPGKEPSADLNEVDAQALDTLGIRLLRGRMIQERDKASTPWVAVINKTFADRHFPGQDPLGQAIRVSIGPAGDGAITEPQPRQIVGVVADVTYPSFSTEKPAAVYIPFRQHLSQYGREDEWIHTRKVLAVRTSVDPLTLVAIDPGRAGRRRSRPGRARFHDHGPARHVVAVGDQQPFLRLALHVHSARWRSCWRWWASTA